MHSQWAKELARHNIGKVDKNRTSLKMGRKPQLYQIAAGKVDIFGEVLKFNLI